MGEISPAALEYVQSVGHEVFYPDGSVILKRGSQGNAFYVVRSGVVDVLLVADDGRRLVLAKLGEGATFGEMSLLTEEPVSADIVARGPVKVLEFPAKQFQAALTDCAALREHILRRLCEDLRHTNSNAWRLFQRAETLKTLTHAEGRAGPLIAKSAAARNVEKRIGELAGHRRPVLILGEAGTGKLFVARKIHEAAADGAPLVVIDCLRLGEQKGEGEACRLLFGSADGRAFQGQPTHGWDLRPIGALDLADNGTLVLRHIEGMDVEAQKVLGRYLEAAAEPADPVSPQVRIIATSCLSRERLTEGGVLHGPLADRLLGETVQMPALVQRRRDTLPLANLFLEEHDRQTHSTAHRLTPDAEQSLLSATYGHRNVAELREAIEFATVFAEGAEIGSEHIFTGPKSEADSLEYDLTPTRAVHWLLDTDRLKYVRGGVLAFFGGLALTCLAFGETAAGRVANGLVWWLWWPSLVVLFVALGRVWCTVCPVSLAGRLAKRLGCLGLALPAWVKKYAVYLSAALFVVIVWAEHVFHMTRQPVATGILLLVLMGTAVVFCLAFDREVWCRYLCPLGTLGASYSLGAIVHVRANSNACAATCTTHDCYKGGADVPGCPVFHHPMYARDSAYCKLCLMCLRSCRHGSARLVVRPPLQGVWRLGDRGEALVQFALVVFLMTLVMLASHTDIGTTAFLPYTAVATVALGAGIALWAALRRLVLPREGRGSPLAVPVAFALLLLGAGPLLAFHLGNMPELADFRIQATAGSFWAERIGLGAIDLRSVLQVAAILGSALLAAVTLARIRSRLAAEGVRLVTWRWGLLLGLCTAYVGVAMVCTLRQGGLL